VTQAAVSEARALRRGQLIADRYRIVRELGRGGMAAVYLCQDAVTGEDVAVKVLFFDQPHAATKYAIWFYQEARALAALDHPSIVHARDFGTMAGGTPYLVMDALEGRSLHAWRHTVGALPWEAVWVVVDRVLSGLAHAHARRIIHGDLKPSNIMVDPRAAEPPGVYVLDLGLAWLLADHLDPRLSGGQAEAPAMPLGGGTPGWLAPEQIRHATPHVGPPTDLYALGCIAFELLSGREVFEGTSDEILRAHRDTPAPAPALKPGVPKGVGPFVQRLLAKRPWHRFRFAAEAMAVWAGFQPRGSLVWTPVAPSGFEAKRILSSRQQPPGVNTAPVSSGPPPGKHLAPGIVALRPCPLVGREVERGLLQTAVDQILRGDGPGHRLAMLEGDAGVGKSRLAEWLCEHVHEHAQMVPLRARYQRIPSPLDGLRGAILAHYNLLGQSRDIIEQALLNEWEVGKGDDEGRTWVAAAAAWLRPPAPDEPAGVGPAGKRVVLDKPELGRAIVRYVVGRISAGRPLCIWLDDVHLAPPATNEGFASLHHDLGSMRFLLVATARAEALAADPAATRRVEALCRILPSFRVHVAPLDQGQTRRLLQSTLPLTPEAEEVAIERSHGNPLFALQLVHAWAGGGYFVQQPGGRYAVAQEALHGRAVTTAGLWDERLAGIPDSYGLAAYAAAALGTDIHHDALAQLLASLAPEGEGAEEYVEHAEEALQKAEILFAEPGDRLRWAHALLHEHCFGRLLESAEASETFRLAADALLFHPDAGTERIVRHRAQNLLYAGEDALAADVLFNFISVAWSSVRDVAATTAALALLEGRVEGRHEGLWRFWTAEVARQGVNLPAARAEAERAERLLGELGDDDAQGHALRLLGQIACDEGRPAAGRAQVEGAYAKFLATGNDAGRAECEFVLGQIESLLGHYEKASERLSYAAQGFRAGGESLSLAQCIMVQARAEMAAGRLSSTRKMLTLARDEFAGLGYPLGLAQVDLALAQAEHNAGRHAAALERALATRARFEALGSVRGRTDSARLAAIAAFDLGKLSLADEQAREAYALSTGESRGDPWGQVEASCVLAQVALARGDVKAASSALSLALGVELDDAEPLQHRELTAAWVWICEKKYDDATAALARARKAFSDPRRTGDHTPQLVERLAEAARGTPVEPTLSLWLASLRARLSSPPPALPRLGPLRAVDQAAQPLESGALPLPLGGGFAPCTPSGALPLHPRRGLCPLHPQQGYAPCTAAENPGAAPLGSLHSPDPLCDHARRRVGPHAPWGPRVHEGV
jgi:eukaryotic-like serine/threonine-protein kinase